MTPTAAIVVNSEGNDSDYNTGDGVCDTTEAGDGVTVCTLRAAIETANTNATEHDTITFGSGVTTIQPSGLPLPSIGDSFANQPVTIDGGGQVTLDGSSVTVAHWGLDISRNAGGSTITGLIIRDFENYGILISDDTGGHTISDNELRENGDGIHVGSNAPSNTIRDNEVLENSSRGIYIASDHNIVTGNKVLDNGGDGIKVSLGSNNQIGGDTGISRGGSCTGDCNLISGNGIDGIDIGQGTDDSTGVLNTVRGNFIGTDEAGTAANPNEGDGIETNGNENHFLGNLISGNGGHGINLSYGADNNVIRGNLIGTQINGTAALGNAGGGVNMAYANGNVIGGDASEPLPSSCTDPCNLISANGAGITITQAIDDGANSIIGNFIGTNADGTGRLGNHGNGVWSQGLNMTISRNLISANHGHGVSIRGVAYGSVTPVNTTTVQSNLIGTAIDGVSDLGNSGDGVFVYWSANNHIGGDQANQGNTIAFNSGAGVVISTTRSGAVGNRILRNSIHSNFGPKWQEMGIDLNGDGVTENDSSDTDSGPNNLQNFPVITDLRGNIISGTLKSAPNTVYRLEFFATLECNFSGHGQGKTFLGSLDVTTDGSGAVIFQTTLDAAPGGQPVVATATDPDGNTSEFSACFGGMVVNSTSDAQDSNRGDGLCDTGQTILNGDPECTLRAALEEANATSDPAIIRFDIPNAVGVPNIYPGSPLPVANYPVTIDGTSQPGGWVQLDGFATNNANGLEIWGGNSRVSGLIICGFDEHGILLTIKGNNVIAGNRIGIDTNNIPCYTGGNGIRLSFSDDNTIGGTTAAARNVIAFSEFSGIYVMDDSSSNIIQGNYIGTDLNGNIAQGSAKSGVHIESNGNTVGGTTGISSDECTGACNLISGNTLYGVLLEGQEAVSNLVQGNFIGTDRTGTTSLGNGEVGIVITDGASDNQIGGDETTMRNLISGNGPSSLVSRLNAEADAVHGGVVINGSTSTGNQVKGNYVGTQTNSDQALPNRGNGVWIYQAHNNTVADNLISGNQENGIEVFGSAATGNTIQGNRIGTNGAGSDALPNSNAGVFVNSAPSNLIGGSETDQGNTLSGNIENGLKIAGDGADDNVVQGNLIGVGTSGAASLPNAGEGILLDEGASGNQVGGTGESEGNVISGNGSNGLQIQGLGTANNLVQGNVIGTLSDAVTRVGNGGHGVYITGSASNNTVGGILTPTTNMIAFNGGDGVCVDIGNANSVHRNVIYENVGLGIDLGPNGVTPNDSGDGDSGPNNLQNFPLLTSLVISGGVATIEGTLNSAATTSYTVEFFANDDCDPSLHGEGQRLLGSISTTTDNNGDATFTFTPSVTISETETIAATATDGNGNTSEFCRCARPTERVPVDPAVGHTLVFTDTQGNLTIVELPAGAITYTETITMAYAPIEETAASGFTFANRAFELSAYLNGTLLSGLTFSTPVTITIHYSDADVAGLGEDGLTLLTWDGSGWTDDGIEVVRRNPMDNYAVFTITHLSDFALFAQSSEVYLPLVIRSGQ